MAINKNHEFEELDGIKCAIVERNATAARTAFLKDLLAYNGYTVIVQPATPPKPPAAATPAEAPVEVVNTTPAPELFTIGVTDVMFNPVNAIFGRLLHTPNGHVVTLAFWKQQEPVPNDHVPYFENRF